MWKLIKFAVCYPSLSLRRLSFRSRPLSTRPRRLRRPHPHPRLQLSLTLRRILPPPPPLRLPPILRLQRPRFSSGMSSSCSVRHCPDAQSVSRPSLTGFRPHNLILSFHPNPHHPVHPHPAHSPDTDPAQPARPTLVRALRQGARAVVRPRRTGRHFVVVVDGRV